MGIYRQLIEWMNDLNSSDFGVMFSFITMIAGIVSSTKFLVKFYGKHSHSIKTYSLLVVILFIGVIFPVFILLSTDWVGWKHILLNVVAIYGLFSFFMLLYIILSMMSVGKRKSVSV